MKQPPKIAWIEVTDDEGYKRMRKVEEKPPLVISNEERGTLAELSKPASRTVIAYHVTRLASHKRMPDDAQMAGIVIKEFTDYLYAEQPKEYELYNAIDYFITKDHSPFFPPLAQVMDAIKLSIKQGYVDSIDRKNG